VSSTSIRIYYSGRDSAGAAYPKYEVVYCRAGVMGGFQLHQATEGSTYAHLTGLQPSTTYILWVYAYDGAGHCCRPQPDAATINGVTTPAA
jgi:hypothetical protein